MPQRSIRNQVRSLFGGVTRKLTLAKRNLPRVRTEWRATDPLPEEWNRAMKEASASRKEEFADKAQPRAYQMFPQGFALWPTDSSELETSRFPRAWTRFTIGNYSAAADALLNPTQASAGEAHVLILGDIVDLSQDLPVTAGDLAPRLARLIDSRQSLSAADSTVNWLSGRYIIFAFLGGGVRAWVDPTASRSCFWGTHGNSAVFASHSSLVARMLRSTSDSRARWALQHPDYVSPSGKWLPGTITAHDKAHLIHANFALSSSKGVLKHERVYPPTSQDNLKRISLELAADIVMQELRGLTHLYLSKERHHHIALTGGEDSLVMLLSALDLYKEADATAMTYHFFSSNKQHSYVDLFKASAIARNVGLPHLLVDVGGFDKGSRFAKVYRTTFPTWARFPSLAFALGEALPRSSSLAFGIGPEIGTMFYRDRTMPKDSDLARFLAGKYTQSKFSKDEELIEEMGRYIDYTGLDTQGVGGIHALDLFYWESRLSGWAATGYAEYHIATDVQLPFNSRRLLVAMLSLNDEQRRNKAVYRELLSRFGWE